MTHIDNVNGLRYNYEYDGIGRLVRQELRTEDNSTHLGATEFAYDLRNNVTKVTNRIGGRTATQSYSYTAIDGLTNSTRYAKDNLPVRYSISSSRYITYDYDAINRLTEKTLSTNTPLTWKYVYNLSNRNAEGETLYRTTQIKSEANGKLAYNYTYDIAGNITSIKYSDANGSGTATLPWVNYRSYTYDDLCQLTSETNATTGKTYTYTYDNVGNILSKSDGTSTIAYTYGTDSDAGWSKLLTSYNGQPIDYDAIGNPISYRGATLTWTGRQLNGYSKGTTSIAYTYDADGLRGSKTVNNATTTYQYLDGKLYYEDRNGTDIYYYYDSYGTISAITAFLPDGRYGTVFVGTNSLGDVNALYDGNGNVVVRYEYDAWGRVISETNANGNALTGTAATWNEINPFRYRGYYYDAETGLYYLQSRYYDPEVGRFISSDGQIAGVGGEPLGYNTYAYCQNNPVNMSDPTGHWPMWLKNTVKWVADNIVKPIVKTVQKTLSEFDLTYSTGINVSGTPSFWIFNGQIGVSMDTKGNVAIQASGGGGLTGGSPSLSISRYKSVTNAPSINELNGLGYQIGGSAIIPVEGIPVAVGGDFNIIPNTERNRTYYGGTLTGGLAAGSPGGEFHVEWGTTVTLPKTQFNIYDVARSVYIKIMEW